MKYSLLLDSSSTLLAVAILGDGEFLYRNSYSAWQRQSEFMIPEIEKALNKLNIGLLDLDEVMVTKGPGSYTGVRIALTIAKTLCTIAPKIKCKTISSLKALGSVAENYIALINARSERSYVAIYQKGKVVLEDCILTNDEVRKLINQYSPQGFNVKGDVKYLNLEAPFEVLEGMKSYLDQCEVEEDILTLKPLYLKD